MKHMSMAAWCPRCDRDDAPIKNGRYRLHTTERRIVDSGHCPMSEMPVPPTGSSEHDFERRAHIIAELAGVVQEYDPGAVWNYLTAADAAELQRMCMLALAAIDINKSPSELWGWVQNLPAARCSA